MLTNRSKVVVKKEMTIIEKLYFPAIAQGLSITLGHFFGKKATIRYPEVQREFSPVYRGKHTLARDEQGRERCTACGLCAVACPAEAITMEAAERKKCSATYLFRKRRRIFLRDTNAPRLFCARQPPS